MVVPGNLEATGTLKGTNLPATVRFTGNGELHLNGYSATLPASGTLSVQTQSLVAGYIVFADANGQLTQDTTHPLVCDPATGFVGIGTATPNTSLNIAFTDTGTTNIAILSRSVHRTSGAPTAGFGSGHRLQAHSSAHLDRTQSSWEASWVDATDASRKGAFDFYAMDTVARSIIRGESDGTQGLLGLFGHAAAIQQASAPVSTDLATVITLANALRTALLNYGAIV